jgi:hypothetical protein
MAENKEIVVACTSLISACLIAGASSLLADEKE